ncbi:arabinose utilization transcriptional regulator AraR [Agathobaculum sp. TL06]
MANFKYMKLASWLKSRLQDGTFSVGQKIPTEAELAEQFDLSRHTVRQAILSLEEAGYLHRIQGSGTYVTEQVKEILPAPAAPQSPHLIGLVLSSCQSYIFPEIAQGASNYLASEGYLLNVMFSGNDFRNEQQVIENLLAARPAGILIEPVNPGILSYNDVLYDKMIRQVPTIFLHKEHSDYCPALSLHDREGARMLTEYLLDMGHTQIGTIFAFNEQTGQSRYMGMLEALYGRQISHSEDLDIWVHRNKVSDLFQPSGCLPLMRMLDQATVVFCHDDRIAYTLITYLRSNGIRVPQDVSVVGYDDGLYSTLDMQITTVTHPKVQYGIKAAQAILELIQSPDTFDIQNYEILPELVVRQTVAPLQQTPETTE